MERAFHFTDIEASDKEVAIMLLNGRIGEDPEDKSARYIDGHSFARELMYWSQAGKKVIVKINSIGGNVLHGWSIMDAVVSAGADTENVGLAASMAGFILMCGKKRRARDYSVTMLHGAQGKATELSAMATAGFKEMCSKRSKMKAERIDEILSKGDHYFDASQMLEAGIVDEVVETKVKFTKPVEASLSQLCELYGSLSDNKPTRKMEWIKKLLGFEDEVQAVQSFQAQKTELDSAKAAIATLTAEKKEVEGKLALAEAALQAAKAGDVKTKATALIEKAIADKKIVVKDDAEKQTLITAAETSYEATEKMLNSIAPVKAISVAAGMQPNIDAGDKAKFTYEYLAKHNPEQLKAIAEKDPELFTRLTDEYNEAQRAKASQFEGE